MKVAQIKMLLPLLTFLGYEEVEANGEDGMHLSGEDLSALNDLVKSVDEKKDTKTQKVKITPESNSEAEETDEAEGKTEKAENQSSTADDKLKAIENRINALDKANKQLKAELEKSGDAASVTDKNDNDDDPEKSKYADFEGNQSGEIAKSYGFGG